MKKIIISTILIGLLLTVPITNVNGSINKKTAMETKITPVIKKEILPLFDSQYRILPNLTRSKLLDQIKFQPGELIIGFKKDIEATISIFPEEAPITNLENIDTLNKEYKVTSFKKIFENDQSSDFSNVYKLTMSSDADVFSAAEDYSEDPNIEFAEPNYLVEFYINYNNLISKNNFIRRNPFLQGYVPNDPYFDQQWALHNIGQTGGTDDADIDAPEAWEKQMGKDSIVVAVLDSGVDYDHPDLTDNIWINPGEDLNGNGIVDSSDFNNIDDDNNGYIDDIRGWNFLDSNNDPMDEYGHGTHCSGIIAASIDNELGIAGIAGKCKIMPLELGDVTSVAESIKYAVDNGADILSMSFGFNFLYQDLELTLVSIALSYADIKGVVLVAAAGNDGLNIFETLPSSHSKVFSVAATNHKDKRPWWSNYGDWVDIAAPGVNILSLRANGTDMYGGGTHIVDEYYYLASGTSMSCPYVAGVAALVLSQKPYLTPREVRTVLRSSTDPVISDFYIGTGRINADFAVEKAQHVAADFSKNMDYKKLEGTVKIKGTAKGLTFQSYSVEYSQGLYPEEGSWVEIGGSNKRKYGGTLVNWNTNDVNDGLYALRLQVTADGQIYKDITWVIVDNQENNYYVDDDYNNSTQGWQITHFDKINDAIAITFDKDIIYVYPGAYNESLDLIEHKSIKMRGMDRESTILFNTTSIGVNRGSIDICNFTFINAGIEIFFSSNSVISNNTFIINNNHSSVGIVFFSKNNKVINNTFMDTSDPFWQTFGIGLFSTSNIVSGNTFNDQGISAFWCNRNTYTNNIVHYINFWFLCDRNTISNNIITDGESRTGEGITMSLCKFNKITDNTISDCVLNDPDSKGVGIFILPGRIGNIPGGFGSSLFNTVSNNTIQNCEYGMCIWGINETTNCEFNQVHRNNFLNNEIGIAIKGVKANKNVIHHNNFIDNDIQAYDECDNTWYNPLTLEGNYWSDYEDTYVPPAKPKLLRSWIWNTPYNISSGDNKDLFPLRYKYSGNYNSYNNNWQGSQSQPSFQQSPTNSSTKLLKPFKTTNS